MPLPTEADLQASIGRRIMMDKTLYDALAVTATTFLTREAAYLLAIPADASPGAETAQATFRSLLTQSTLQLVNGLASHWATYAQLAALRPNEDFWRELRRYFVANNLTVKYRNVTFGSWSAVTGSGTGYIYRLTKDQDNFNIEAGFAETKTAECIADQNNGAQRHAEVFRVRGAPAGKDALELVGTGRFVDVTCLSPNSSGAIVKNPSFESVTVSSYPTITDIANWTPSSISNLETETTTYFKDNPQATTSRSLRFKTNASIVQSFTDLGLKWDPNVPLFAQIAFYRESSCDGSLNIIIGNVTATVVLAAQVGWTILTFPVTTNAWYLNWKKTAPSGSLTNAAVTISLTGRSTGTLLIDDFTIGPYTQVDGCWVAIVGGATPFLLRDKFTITDSSADTGIVQTILARRYGQYLPSTSGSPTWTEPT